MHGDTGSSSGTGSSQPPEAGEGLERRTLLARGTTFAMAAGLAASYGTCAAMSARFLYPARPRPRAWLFVVEARRLAVDGAVSWRAPTGEPITVARQGAGLAAEDFVALSSTCPHLGCQVHWEPQNTRFFCPCRNGVFDPGGRAVSGPPAEAGQSLPRYPLKVEDGLLFIEAPVEGLARRAAPPRPGHDPCLAPRGDPA